MPFCCLLGIAEAKEGGDAEKVYLWYRRLHQGVAPVYRSPLLSASGGSAFAAAPAAPLGSGQYSVGPLTVRLRQMSLLGWELASQDLGGPQAHDWGFQGVVEDIGRQMTMRRKKGWWWWLTAPTWERPCVRFGKGG